MLFSKRRRTAKISDAATLNCASPADEVAGNDYLLTEILLLLPIKPLLRFKSVSRHWLSLITSPYFSRRRQPFPYTPSGLFIQPSISWLSIFQEIDFIPLNNDENLTDSHFPSLTSFPGLPTVRILSSSNGLLCCSSNINPTWIGSNYYIYNPTTRQSIKLHRPIKGAGGRVDCLNLAFDPSNSAFYKVFCVWSTEEKIRGHAQSQIEIYSSGTGRWSKSGELFSAHNIQFESGVYWNRAINWVSYSGNSLYFNVDQERLGTLPMLPVPDGRFNRPSVYFGNSGDRLHLIDICDPVTLQFNVYEMKRDYSEWFLNYQIDLDGVTTAFPEIIRSRGYYDFLIVSLVRREKDEDSFLVLQMAGKAIRFNFGDKSFKKLCIVAPCCSDAEVPTYPLEDIPYQAFQYIESLSHP